MAEEHKWFLKDTIVDTGMFVEKIGSTFVKYRTKPVKGRL